MIHNNIVLYQIEFRKLTLRIYRYFKRYNIPHKQRQRYVRLDGNCSRFGAQSLAPIDTAHATGCIVGVAV